MDILVMLLMQGTASVSRELLLLPTGLIYPLTVFPRGRLCLCMCEQCAYTSCNKRSVLLVSASGKGGFKINRKRNLLKTVLL